MIDTFHLKLTALSPVFVGSGKKLGKYDYVFDPATAMVTVYQMEKLFWLLAENNLADDYERFVMSGSGGLYNFIRNCRLTAKQLQGAELYRVKAADALDKDRSIKEIHQFMRMPDARPYIPGSSLKGALRTVILHSLLNEKTTYTGDRFWAENLESKLINTLPLPNNRQNVMTQSILRGLSVSDSEPVGNHDLILSAKKDCTTDGRLNSVNVVRECARPGTVFRFAVSIDSSICPFGRDKLMEMIRFYDRFYEQTYQTHFVKPGNAAEACSDEYIYIGGGSGYFSKNIVYRALPKGEGLHVAADNMMRKFSKHHHELDVKRGISPHMMKYTQYQGVLYPVGLCKVEFCDDKRV